MATLTLAEPNTLPTTVGIVEKKPPFPVPLIITNAIRGPRVVETGHSTSMLRELSSSEMRRVLSGPKRSLMNPQPRRPTADEKLKPATSPAPALGESPSEVLYNGRKKGGTKRGKVATTPVRNRTVNLKLRKRFLVILVSIVYS
jgi:hypothetical protein